MQDYAKSNRLSLNTILFFAILLFIAFLPISSFLFFIKNDAFTGYFPPKFFMSESIHAGYLPLWNPYINYGFPQYGDMSGGYWSPITWLIASTAGYNAYTFTIETLCYILIGGIGIYKLCDQWQLSKYTAVIAGISFMCCGYHVGHLQHFNWLSGSAFLPWCLWAYMNMLKGFSIKRILQSVLVFYMLLSSAHPGIVIGAFYFFLLLFLFMLLRNNDGIKKKWKQTTYIHLVFIAGILLLGAGLIAGYSDLMPHFIRGEKIDLQSALLNDTSLPSWISLLFPFATVKNEALFATDISMRNCYTGLLLLVFLLLACVRKKNSWQIFFLITGILFALLSSGGIFKIIAYKFIPFIGYVRLNGEFRIFSLLCFILVSAIELDKYIQAKEQFRGRIKWILNGLQLIVAVGFITGLLNVLLYKNSFIFNTASAPAGMVAKLKYIIDNISFYDTLWIQGIIQLVILQAIKFSLKRQRWQILKFIVAADLILTCLLNIPFTGAGKASVADLQQVINRAPHGITSPYFIPTGKTDSIPFSEQQMIGDWSMYNKQIGTNKEVLYPIILNNMRAYFESIEKGDSSYLKKPYLFFEKQNAGNGFDMISFTGNRLSVFLHAEDSGKLILQQNWYPHWKDKMGNAVGKEGINFMFVPLQKGDQTVKFIFDPRKVKYAMLLSLITFTLMILALLFFKLRQSSLSSRRKRLRP